MRRRVLTGIIAAALLLTGCSASPDPDRSTASPSPTGLGAEDIVGDVSVTVGPATLTAEVHPLVRTDDGLVLTMDLTSDLAPADDVEDYEITAVWSSSSRAQVPTLAGLRLLDLAHDRVAPPAVTADGDSVFVLGELPAAAASASPAATSSPAASPVRRIQVLYGDPGSDAESLQLLVPQGGVVSGIPVIDAEPPAAPIIDDSPVIDDGSQSSLAGAASAPVYPLTSFQADTATQTRQEQNAEKVHISLGSDVLFATDSARLTAAAKTVIADAATELATREPGTVRVVGYTDSVDTDAYNLALSKKRAQAVADALKDLIDTDDYPLEISGRGEADPVASNDTAAGRAANRRVELTLDTAAKTETTTDAAAVPPIDGPTATGAEGLDIDGGRPYHVAAPSARMIDGHPVVTITITATDDAVDSAFGPALFEGSFAGPAGLDRLRSMAGVALMNGSVATVPGLHEAAGADPGTLLPLTDLSTFKRLDGGDTRTTEIVYPAMATGDTVTLQLLDTFGAGSAFQLTDIPVTAEGD
ncbi:OmpA family protein [Microbacterium sp. KR10-403]|uniref:OmpA family protein n=1 Tax=Microbacterium sp. KR10-403 TaxID=3158581 RepID=UPI0032E48698